MQIRLASCSRYLVPRRMWNVCGLAVFGNYIQHGVVLRSLRARIDSCHITYSARRSRRQPRGPTYARSGVSSTGKKAEAVLDSGSLLRRQMRTCAENSPQYDFTPCVGSQSISHVFCSRAVGLSRCIVRTDCRSKSKERFAYFEQMLDSQGSVHDSKYLLHKSRLPVDSPYVGTFHRSRHRIRLLLALQFNFQVH